LSQKVLPFSPLLKLKKDQKFIWGDEQQKAFDEIKQYRKEPAVLVPPQLKKHFKLYVAADTQTIGSALMQEFEGKERVVAYLSRKLLDPETRYSAEITPWALFFDGSSCGKGGGVGIILISPRGEMFEFAIPIQPTVTNNQAEYEELLRGLQYLKEAGAVSVEIYEDSELVIKKLNSQYECKSDALRNYYEECREILKSFQLVILQHILREHNEQANRLAQSASGYRENQEAFAMEVCALGGDLAEDDWRKEIVGYLEDPSRRVSRKLRYKAKKFVLLDGSLFYKSLDGVLLRCLGPQEAKNMMSEVHDGICGAHQSAYRMK
jgi:ribonuclease HI